MTGLKVRVEREGRWQHIDIDELTRSELFTEASKHPVEGWRWAMALVTWIQENVEEPGSQDDSSEYDT